MNTEQDVEQNPVVMETRMFPPPLQNPATKEIRNAETAADQVVMSSAMNETEPFKFPEKPTQKASKTIESIAMLCVAATIYFYYFRG